MTQEMILVLVWIGKFFLVLILWTLLVYALHYIAHQRFKYNVFNYLHRFHHQVDYQNDGGSKFQWKFLYWNFGDIRITLDLFVMITLPLLLLTFFFFQQGIVLLILHYVDEVFLSERVLDHNPNVKGRFNKFWVWGEYHLKHHENPKKNLSFIFTFWDKLFGTTYKHSNTSKQL
jgi:sterol desaturase/sphingolipid hydroxylase (fatty acid hydroxylase superfamily)